MKQLAIVGAGVAGLTAARTLKARHPGLAITIYEKSRALGGRAATRRRDGFVFDHGAQYMKTPTAELEHLLRDELPSDDLFDIGQPVWVFDGAGTIAEGDPAQNADPKWCYTAGLNTLGKLLGADLDVQREARIGKLAYEHNAWRLLDVEGRHVGNADIVVLAVPAPQSAEIVQASAIPDAERAMLMQALSAARYRRCLAFTLAYRRIIARPFYALVNSDRAHPISWLALEHAKGPQRGPAGSSLLIAQMAPQWSLEQWDTPLEELHAQITGLVGDLLSEDLDEPLWIDRQGWRYALPDGKAERSQLDGLLPGLFFAGDALEGQGRVHLAIESGWRVAGAIEQTFTGV
ncbi:MAG TPA: FAD-dependent oxidoreductase [Roseiflexaceae bacterium]|nr:FAD-dependent oxidoreductase [Roseiflexaceae bacterium]